MQIAPTITIELSAEDRERVDLLIALLKENRERTEPLHLATAVAAQEPAAAPEPEAPADDSPAPAEPEQAAPAAAEEPEKVITKEELQAMVQELAAPGTGKRDQVRAIVLGYAKRVTDIPEDKRAEVMQKLIDLKEGKA